MRWVLLAGLLAGCPRPSTPAVPPVPDAGPPCPLDAWPVAERCELVKSIFHLDGPKGHEVEWYVTDCAKWPAKLDVSVACAGDWKPIFEPNPGCDDEKMVAVNLRDAGTRARGILLRLSPEDGGVQFVFQPGQLSDGKPIDSLCGTVSGFAARADGGWIAHTPP